jgi:type II secretory pathway pseudopilin PulG
MRLYSFFRNEKGFTIAEVVVSIGILMVGAVGTIAIIQSSFGGAATSRHIMVATNLARGKIEEIRSTPFANITTTHPANNASPITLSSLPNGQWYRTYPAGTSVDPLKIKVVVSWVEGNKTRSISLETLVSSK